MEIFENFDWLLYGILIGLFVPITLLLGNKQFGISSALQNVCFLIVPKSRSVFSLDDLKKNDWKFYFVIGIVLGAILVTYLSSSEDISYLPSKYYSFEGVFILFIGGFLVGFGTRYANGCTSGHSITGLSLLQLSSLVATISFFIGGLLYTFIF